MLVEPEVTDLRFHPAQPERWADLEKLFGTRGACAGCWCMWWRLNRSDWSQGRGEGNRVAFKSIVESGRVPGILAYLGAEPVGWCAVAPREEYAALARSRKFKAVDDQSVWSIVCFFIAGPFRKHGVTVQLLEATAEYVRSKGGRIVEGYPTKPERKTGDAQVYMGTTSAFEKAGFVEIARRSKNSSIMRLILH